MQLYIRRILLILSVFCFISIAPLIVLYAMGYRPGASFTIAPPVGVAIIDAKPRKATIEVNGTAYGTLPRSIPNLVPGFSTIKVTKERYLPWVKKVEIKPATAIDLRAIQLIPSALDSETILQNSTAFAVSPTESFIASVDTEKKLQIYDENGLASTSAIPLQKNVASLSWSPDESYILATFQDKTYEIFQITGSAIEKIKSIVLNGNAQAQWDPAKIGNLFFVTPKHALVSYSVLTGISQQIKNEIITYAIHERNLLLQTLDNSLISKRIGFSPETVLLTDAKKGIQEIIPSNGSYTALLFEDGELQISTKNGEMRHIAVGVQAAMWSVNGNTLLIQSANGELDVYTPDGVPQNDIPSGELHLVVRLSKSINPIGWFPDNEHIAYEADGNTIFSETDTRDHAVTNILQKNTPANSASHISSDGKSIISLSKDADTTSLVRTWLVTKEDR